MLPSFCFHLADQENWSSVQRNGLLSASWLMDRAGLNGINRKVKEHGRRKGRTVLPDGTMIRDNKPLPFVALERCLVGMSPAEWFALLNSKIFYWLDLSRLESQHRACGACSQVLMVFETAALVSKHEAMATVTPINTGSPMRKTALREAQTFVSVADWRCRRWTVEMAMTGKRRRCSHPRGTPSRLIIRHDLLAFLEKKLRTITVRDWTVFFPCLLVNLRSHEVDCKFADMVECGY
jgi:hypothetical protein